MSHSHKATTTLRVFQLHPRPRSAKTHHQRESAISEELPSGLRRHKKSKVTVSTPRMTVPANPIAPSAAARDRIPQPVMRGYLTYLMTNLRIPTPIPSRFGRLPMRLRQFPSQYPLYFRQVTSLTIFSVSSGILFASSTFDELTYHRELREAQLDSDFDQVIVKLAHEWYFIGAPVSTDFFLSRGIQELIRYPSYFPSPHQYFFFQIAFLEHRIALLLYSIGRVCSASPRATSSWLTILPSGRW
jgi:hypothetical protein